MFTTTPDPKTDKKKYRFGGHETFPFRYSWLPKGVQKLAEYPDLFSRDDAIVILGVGKNMVKSIRFWCTALGLIQPLPKGKDAQPTPLGLKLFAPDGWDPYLEDVGTLWLLHWLLLRRPGHASTWHLVFTRWNSAQFTRTQLTDWLYEQIQGISDVRATRNSLKRDVDVFLRTYIPSRSSVTLPLEDTFDCPLVELDLLREIDHNLYQFVHGPKASLPDLVFAFALVDFWQDTAPQQQTLSFEHILYGAGSPGAAFKLSEDALIERLERLPTQLGLSFDDTAGMRVVLRQTVRVERELPSILEDYYSKTLSG